MRDENTRSVVSRDTTQPGRTIAIFVLAIGMLLLGGMVLLIRHRLLDTPPAPVADRPAQSPSVPARPSPAIPSPESAVPSNTAPSSAAEPATAQVERVETLIPVAPSPPPDPRIALVEGLRNGQLRLAGPGDTARWVQRWSDASRHGVPHAFAERIAHEQVYVVQKDFTFPDGLYGADAAIFLIERRTPFPRGNPGHSALLDMASGSCTGAICGSLLYDD